MLADLGEIGALGLYVEPEYGGQGLSQTGYARVFETIGQIDATLAIVLGVHQSIGFKGISLFGTDEQKERFLPDLASGRKLAASRSPSRTPALTRTTCSRGPAQADGSWVLNGEKRYIGNGSRADVITTFARAEVDGEERHIALLLEKGMKGLEVGERYDTMGLRANDLRRLRFNDVRVPPENVLGDPASFASRCRSSTTAGSVSVPVPSAEPSSCSTWRSITSRSGDSSGSRWPTSSSSRTRSAGWWPTSSDSSRCAT